MSAMTPISRDAINRVYLKELKTEVKNRRRSKLLRKKVFKELKKSTPTVKPVKTNVKSKKALMADEAKEMATMFRDSERLAQKLVDAKTKEAKKAAKKLAAKQAKAKKKALKGAKKSLATKQSKAEKKALKEAKKLAAAQAKEAKKVAAAQARAEKKALKKQAKLDEQFAKKAISLLKFAQANEYTIDDIVAELKAQVEPSRSDNFVTIVDSENSINM